MLKYLMTLDSHEYFGPFINIKDAHAWAKATGRTSYMIVWQLPHYAKDQLQATKMPDAAKEQR